MLDSLEKVKYINITCVLLGIIFPLISIITSMADFAVDLQKRNENSTFQFRKNSFLSRGLGFEVDRFSPTRCSSTRHDAIFYSYVLTSDIMLGCGCTYPTLLCGLYTNFTKETESRLLNRIYMLS